MKNKYKIKINWATKCDLTYSQAVKLQNDRTSAFYLGKIIK